MKAYWRMVVLAAIFLMVGQGMCDLWGQDDAWHPSVLHIQHSAITSKTGFPQFLYMYHVLDEAKSRAEARALTGTISLENHSANFSEVPWLLAYWEGACPVNDQSLSGQILFGATF